MLRCPECGTQLSGLTRREFYDEERDAYFCRQCNVWLEEKCGNPECEFCANRPESPLATEAEG